MIFADSGYFLGLVMPNDALHRRATWWARSLREPILTTEWVLIEIVDALSRPINRGKAHRLIASLRQNPLCEIFPASPELFEAGLRFHASRLDKEWSLTDCISFHVMQQRGLFRALAFDHHFEQAGFEALLRREPQGR